MVTLTCYRCGNSYNGIKDKDLYCPSCTDIMGNIDESKQEHKRKAKHYSIWSIFFPI